MLRYAVSCSVIFVVALAPKYYIKPAGRGSPAVIGGRTVNHYVTPATTTFTFIKLVKSLRHSHQLNYEI